MPAKPSSNFPYNTVYNIYYISSSQLNQFIQRLKETFRVFAPMAKPDNFTREPDYSFKKLEDGEEVVFNPYRAQEPLKSFFTHVKEDVSAYFGRDMGITELGKTVIFGVKSCDIAGHKIQDFVFLEGVEVDSLYRVRRENTIIISGDCTDFRQVCHCLAWDIQPHPTWGFDLNLSPLNDGYLVEVGSDKGAGLIRQYAEYFSTAKDVQIAARLAKRESLIDRLKRHLLPQNLVHRQSVQKIVKDGYSLDTWQQFMLTCVECGGCNFICDTCHCFLLADKKEGRRPILNEKLAPPFLGRQNKKIRLWDACLYANYSRVAGGANPLKLRAHRLRFRFTKKFDFFVDNLGMPACCGCGRCIEVCPGKIDIREVLKDLSKKLKVVHLK